MKEKWIGWHFVAADGKLRDGTKARVGRVERVEGRLNLCHHGLHASARIRDALKYAPGPLLSRVELRGERIDVTDKSCAKERKRLTHIDCTRMLHEFALWCARRTLMRERKAGREPDPRSWEALEVKRLWLKGKATDEELEAARAAAEAAAWGTAWRVAWSAVWSIAWRAAEVTAWGTAEAAAWSAAGESAWQKEIALQERWLQHEYAKLEAAKGGNQ